MLRNIPIFLYILLTAKLANTFSLNYKSAVNLSVNYNKSQLNIVSRQEWKAREPRDIQDLSLPVPMVIIHHSYEPSACYNLEECCEAMRSMQNFHMDTRGWADIGYNFAVGSDGRIYEGRGWSRVGAQALHYNFVSIGICLIGNWNATLPPPQQLESTKKLIEYGLVSGYVASEYILIGHRQVRDTECPGDNLFDEIKHWPHFTTDVHSPNYYYKIYNVNKL